MVRPDTFLDSRNVLIEATPSRFIFQYRTNTAEDVGGQFAATAYGLSQLLDPAGAERVGLYRLFKHQLRRLEPHRQP